MARATRFVKLFFLCTTVSLIIFIFTLIHDARRNLFNKHYGYDGYIHKSALAHLDDVQQRYYLAGGEQINSELPSDTKYILLWTGEKSGLGYMGRGRRGFIDNKCPVSNCFVTSDKKYLKDYTAFDAVVFSGPQVVGLSRSHLPKRRSPKQKYIFATFESSHYYPACDTTLDGFFNWTWTYKLDSDARWGYIVVRDINGTVIGPKIDMNWISEMDPIDEELKKNLKSKKKAAALFVSNCHSKSNREGFVREVKEILKEFGLQVDVFGDCGPFNCPRNRMDACLKMLGDNYYFYFSFENSITEDYVTEKLVHPLQHNTVPIVYGGANYTRFMPDGMYLNGRALGAKNLAQTMFEIISEPERYHDFFRYKKYYSFHRRVESVETNDYCNICAMLNDEVLVNTKTVYENFREWWNPKSFRIC